MSFAPPMGLSFARPASPASRRRIAAMLIVAVGISSLAWMARPATALAWDEEAFSASAEHELVALTNQARASAGRKALRVSSTLTSIARWRSKDMVDRDYFSHDIPGYGKVFKKMSAVGFCYDLAGENIGWNMAADSVAAERIQEMFMDSSGHRANILGKAYDTIGIGAYKSASGKHMFTVLLADKCGSAKPKPDPKPKPKPDPRPRAKPDPKPDPKPAAKPKPRPDRTPDRTPAAKPTSEPTPTPILIDALLEPPIWLETDAPSTVGDDPSPPAAPTASPAPDASAADPTAVADPRRLRIGPAASPPGLVDAIVGGVTGAFLGG